MLVLYPATHRLLCERPSHRHLLNFADTVPMMFLSLQIAVSNLEGNYGTPALRAARNRMRCHENDRLVLPIEVALELPGPAFRPAALAPEIHQHVQKKNEAQDVQKEKMSWPYGPLQAAHSCATVIAAVRLREIRNCRRRNKPRLDAARIFSRPPGGARFVTSC